MDKLSLQFAKAAAIKEVENCTDLGALKKLAIAMVQAHYSSRELLATLMQDNMKLLAKRCSNCPLR